MSISSTVYISAFVACSSLLTFHRLPWVLLIASWTSLNSYTFLHILLCLHETPGPKQLVPEFIGAYCPRELYSMCMISGIMEADRKAWRRSSSWDFKMSSQVGGKEGRRDVESERMLTADNMSFWNLKFHQLGTKQSTYEPMQAILTQTTRLSYNSYLGS